MLEVLEVLDLYHDSFYRFVQVEDPQQLASELQDLCVQSQLLGSILVASEGINGMLAGTQGNLDAFWNTLHADPRFAGLQAKRSPSSEMPFKRLKIKVKPELVPLGIEGVDASSKTGVQVPPDQWLNLIQQQDVVLLDNRNDFEARIGTFEGAINPGVKKFRDFAKYVLDHQKEWEGKRIAMFCTGGIRCEKASAWMLDLGMEVYQLEGGIMNYFLTGPEQHDGWTGECFVFDHRVTLDGGLEESDLSFQDVNTQFGDGVKS
ncbi:oxygen-dependent tRNA uridine(34) hydroxylase TrhO [Deinococcus roseus]|uniref:oxygen-dependent tRNA uridine(34) hydroxylase TrhO n=1 Tax=Deinococcus roseus TaxID=392414 RepID=UPI001665EC3F|nr:rhodanese-like domain-containing protein [Deinococcus roseus]